MPDRLQLILIATFPARARLGSGTDLISQCSVIKPINIIKLALSKPSSQPILALAILDLRIIIRDAFAVVRLEKVHAN